jgi:hypothetical protein
MKSRNSDEGPDAGLTVKKGRKWNRFKFPSPRLVLIRFMVLGLIWATVAVINYMFR